MRDSGRLRPVIFEYFDRTWMGNLDRDETVTRPYSDTDRLEKSSVRRLVRNPVRSPVT